MNEFFDSHIHLWKYSESEFPWITEGMNILQKDFFMREYIAELEVAEKLFLGGILVQARQCWDETEFLCSMSQTCDRDLSVVGWVEMQQDQLEKFLKTKKSLSQFKNLRGFRHLVQDESDNNYMSRLYFRKALAIFARQKFTYDILVRSFQLQQVLDYLKTEPVENQPILIVDHIAKPTIGGTYDSFLQWKRLIFEIAEYEHVSCKISGLLTEVVPEREVTEDVFNGYIEVVLEAFGCDRLMIGSDWPVCLLKGSIHDSLLFTRKTVLEELSLNEREKIYKLNAQRIYEPA